MACELCNGKGMIAENYINPETGLPEFDGTDAEGNPTPLVEWRLCQCKLTGANSVEAALLQKANIPDTVKICKPTDILDRLKIANKALRDELNQCDVNQTKHAYREVIYKLQAYYDNPKSIFSEIEYPLLVITAPIMHGKTTVLYSLAKAMIMRGMKVKNVGVELFYEQAADYDYHANLRKLLNNADIIVMDDFFIVQDVYTLLPSRYVKLAGFIEMCIAENKKMLLTTDITTTAIQQNIDATYMANKKLALISEKYDINRLFNILHSKANFIKLTESLAYLRRKI